MSRLLALNKPFHVLSQFSPLDGKSTLKDYLDVPHVVPAGRLDYDSEGLLLLTDNGRWQARISQPGQDKWAKVYWVQVENKADPAALESLHNGVLLKDGWTLPAGAEIIDEPKGLWLRQPPVRYRASIPTQWLRITLHEGRNRQVRRMTAAVGLPTLRLIRYAIGPFTLEGLAPGQWCDLALPSASWPDDLSPSHQPKTHGQRRFPSSKKVLRSSKNP
ncbi:MAG: pseudouridine synthase [Pseudomonadales bacterium]|nr:pseudouridine synthase [Pseudomonadales bacterium]